MMNISTGLSLLFLFANAAVYSQTKSPQGHCCASKKTSDAEWYTSGKKAPLFKGLDGINFEITSKEKKAKQYFNQGMMLSYAFNHAEAARSFYEVTRIDSDCAMGWWGYAYVLGPNYNGGMEKDNYDRAFRAVQKAKSKASGCTQKEKDLIDALTERYVEFVGGDRKPLDSAYAEAMRKVFNKYKDDVEVTALFAESLMDLHPWDLYDKKGVPKEWTPEITDLLEKAIKLAPQHAGANHFYIHAVEASANPEKGIPSADLLRNLVPGAGHLVHMPAHIYIHTGQYHDASLANQTAIDADHNYFTACHAQGVYPLAYFPHNYHFLAATATYEGNSKLALMAAQKVAEYSDSELMSKPEWATLQHYSTIPYFVAVKFGKWDEILKMNEPRLLYPQVIYHYATGFAWLAKGNVAMVEEELNKMKQLMEDTSLKSLTIWGINSLYSVAEIALYVLEGEMMAFHRNYDGAIGMLGQAVTLEDKLNYDEPPDWFFSVRHNLGAVLIEAGRYGEAINILMEDLKNHKDNGWAMAGLIRALQLSGNEARVNYFKPQFDAAWKNADIRISSSRIAHQLSIKDINIK